VKRSVVPAKRRGMKNASTALIEELFAGCDKLSTLELVKAKVLVPLYTSVPKGARK
jgi:hypothetical protein